MEGVLSLGRGRGRGEGRGIRPEGGGARGGAERLSFLFLPFRRVYSFFQGLNLSYYLLSFSVNLFAGSFLVCDSRDLLRSSALLFSSSLPVRFLGSDHTQLMHTPLFSKPSMILFFSSSAGDRFRFWIPRRFVSSLSFLSRRVFIALAPSLSHVPMPPLPFVSMISRSPDCL